MILIADSGSTKTDWAIVTASSQPVVLSTQGINPIHQSREQIVQIIREEFMGPMGSSPDVQKLRSGSILSPDFPYAVYFYGSGVRPEMEQLMSSLLSELFPQASIVEAHSDLLGAARALCGRKEGIACILGTGANSCLYDGNGIVQHTPALGYILGDEGSGAVLGKHFVADLCKGLMPSGLLEEFLSETHQTVADIIGAVYRQPLPNRYLAQTSRFIHQHLHIEAVRQLVVDNFRAFFSRNLTQYGRPDLPVRAIGSVAYYYRSQLEEAAALEGYHLDQVEVSPMLGLMAREREA